MKVRAFSADRVTKDNPNGKCVLDLTVAKDIETFGGQDAVDYFMEMQKNPLEERVKALEDEIDTLKAAR